MDIKLYKNNAKQHPISQLKKIAASIKQFGFRQACVVDKDGVLIIGHGRYLAATTILNWHELKNAGAAKKGDEFIPYVIADDLSPEEIKALRLADNKLNESVWDKKLMMEDLEMLPADLFAATGFDQSILAVKEDKFDGEGEYKKIKEPKTKPGDVYILGKHKLICGDSTLVEPYDELLGDERAQLIFTDPPYNVNYESKSGGSRGKGKHTGVTVSSIGTGNKIFNDNKTEEQFLQFVKDFASCCFVYSDEQAPMYMWYATRNAVQFQNGIEAAGFKYSQTVIWVKEHIVFGFGVNYHRAFEPCMVCVKDGKFRKNKDFANLSDIWELDKQDFGDMIDVWYQQRDDTTKYVHPTQKPVRLAERAFRRNTSEGDIVLDVFGGSGSTLIACEQMNRKARLIEYDPKYCDVIVKRYCQFTDKYDVIRNGEKLKWSKTIPIDGKPIEMAQKTV